MKEKEMYFLALAQNNGALNEIDLGEQLGLSHDETMRAIATLLSENKIAYIENKACNYSIMKNVKGQLNREAKLRD